MSSKLLLLYGLAALLLVLTVLTGAGQAEEGSEHESTLVELSKESPSFEINNAQLRDKPHHIVKRKSKIGGRGFSFGKKGKSKGNQNREPYPKQPQSNPYPQQPAYNPNYNPGHAGGAPPAYPGSNSRPGYPNAPPPPYPGTGGHHNAPGYPPAYPGTGGGYGGYGQPNYGAGGFGGKGYNTGGGGFGGMGKGFGGGGGGLGRTLGSAGFGAVAGTALGAYGGYKLGKMVGSMGRHGHYGYYDDYGKYIRCEPPKNIKVDPETNVTYIPLSEDYDKRCSYFDRRPPERYIGYTNGGALTTQSPINRLVVGVLNWTFCVGHLLMWDNVLVLALMAAVIMFR